MTDWLADLEEGERNCLEPSPQAGWISPMLATLTAQRFSDPDWIFERKLDGERALAVRNGIKVRLLTRNRKSIGKTYPELVAALSDQACDDFVVDGEIVTFEDGVTSFSRLQQRMQITDPKAARASSVPVYYYLFDIPYLDGRSLAGLPLRRRKSILKRVVSFEDPLRYTAHRNRDGEAYFHQACEKGWEGVIAKRAAAPYRHGRSKDWLKFKCAKGQELVIAGFTKPKRSRTGFGALLVGYYDGDALRFAGKVGTGYDDAFLADFRHRLETLTRQTSPFADQIPEKDVTWVSPQLVGEFGFTEWTKNGKLRHPRFLGLRHDKEPEDVVRETPDG